MRLHQSLGMVPQLAIIVALWLMPSAAQAQSIFYVRQGASGSGTGTDWMNAYATLPGVLQRGATYYVADGSYGNYVFDDAHSGTLRIVIKKATIVDHGASTGWQADFGDDTAAWTNWVVQRGYYTFDGQTRSGDWRSGYGFKVGPSAINRIIDMYAGGAATADNVTFRYIEVHGNGLDNVTHDDGFYSPAGNDNVVIQYAYLHDFGRCAVLTGSVTNWTLEYSVIARNSSSPAVHSEGWAASNDDGLIVRFNQWEDIEGTGIIVALSRSGEVATCNDWQVYGNTFMYSPGNPYNRDGLGLGAVVAINTQIAVNWKVYNNTFIHLKYGFSSRIQVGFEGQTGNANVQVYNNFWFDSQWADNELLSCTNCVSASNRYDGTGSSNEPDKETRLAAEPSVFLNYVAKNFRLTAPTQPGTPLPSPYDTDMDGISRSADAVWDRGAYEFGGTVPTAPIRPTNLRIVG